MIFNIFKLQFKFFNLAHPFICKTHAKLVLAYATFHNLNSSQRISICCIFGNLLMNLNNQRYKVYKDNNCELIIQTQEQEREEASLWRTDISYVK